MSRWVPMMMSVSPRATRRMEAACSEGLRNRETLMRIWRDIQKQKRQARGGR